jgi:hypothetical protein
MNIETIYYAYPRKVGRRRALLEIELALRRISKEVPHLLNRTEKEVEQLMLNTVLMFANSPAGKRKNFTPHPSTWFHQSRYLDDPEEWFHVEGTKQDDLARRNADSLATVFGKLPDQNRTSVFACADGGRGSGLERLPRQLSFGSD